MRKVMASQPKPDLYSLHTTNMNIRVISQGQLNGPICSTKPHLLFIHISVYLANAWTRLSMDQAITGHTKGLESC